jgi:hypothetical protein
MTEESEASVPHYNKSAEHLPLPAIYDAYESLQYAHRAIHARPISASMLADAPLPHGSDATLCECGYIVRGFQNSSLPPRSAS